MDEKILNKVGAMQWARGDLEHAADRLRAALEDAGAVESRALIDLIERVAGMAREADALMLAMIEDAPDADTRTLRAIAYRPGRAAA